MNHSISLEKAKLMTARYRKEKEKILDPNQQGKDILPLCERFDGTAIQEVLNQPGCVNIRIYYGMDEDLKTHAIIVGVNDNDEDMLPDALRMSAQNLILDEAVRCPSICPPASALNS